MIEDRDCDQILPSQTRFLAFFNRPLVNPADEMMFHRTKLQGTMPTAICNLGLNDLVADCEPIDDFLPARLVCPRTCCTDCFDF